MLPAFADDKSISLIDFLGVAQELKMADIDLAVSRLSYRHILGPH